ncbi:MAG: hypothetical protein JW828_11060 [Sedimentisphaerales bacterium]|nr:hypothetical protein [Sedimentisphaerales bacterium]
METSIPGRRRTGKAPEDRILFLPIADPQRISAVYWGFEGEADWTGAGIRVRS